MERNSPSIVKSRIQMNGERVNLVPASLDHTQWRGVRYFSVIPTVWQNSAPCERYFGSDTPRWVEICLALHRPQSVHRIPCRMLFCSPVLETWLMTSTKLRRSRDDTLRRNGHWDIVSSRYQRVRMNPSKAKLTWTFAPSASPTRYRWKRPRN